jgi:hypothetical protein
LWQRPAERAARGLTVLFSSVVGLKTVMEGLPFQTDQQRATMAASAELWADRAEAEQAGGGLVASAGTHRALGAVASVLRIIGWIIVAILVIHILLTVFDANPANNFATFIRSGANMFSLGLTDLFTQLPPKMVVAVNYGIAALVWLVLTSIVVGLVRRIG